MSVALSIVSPSAVASTRYNNEFAYLAVTCGSPPEVWHNNPFGVGTSIHALGFDRSMALLLGIFGKSATITRQTLCLLFLVFYLFFVIYYFYGTTLSKPRPMFGAPGQSWIFSIQWQ